MHRACSRAAHAALLATTLAAGTAVAQGTVIEVPADTRVAVSVTLLKRSFNAGRDTPVFNNYSPQVRFSGESAAVTCTLKIHDPPEKIEPGQTQDVALLCVAPFKVRADQRTFTLFEGGRMVGTGTLH